MQLKQPLTLHQREGRSAISWLRQRRRHGPLLGRQPNAEGPLVEFLTSSEVDRFALGDSSVGMAESVSPISRLADAFSSRLDGYQIGFPSLEIAQLRLAWHAVDYHVRRAWLCLCFLADRHCELPVVTRNRKGARLKGRGQRIDRDYQLPTTHLVRLDGLAATDLEWLGGADSRAKRRRIVETLEKYGVVTAQRRPGAGTRYVVSSLETTRGFEPLMRAAHRDELRSIANLARSVTGPARRKPSSPDQWDAISTTVGPEAFVVGATLPPAIRRFLETQLDDLIHNLTMAMLGRTGPKGYKEWRSSTLDRLVRERKPASPSIVIPLF